MDLSCSSFELILDYTPPLDWPAQIEFWQQRTLAGVEWVDGLRYGRTFSIEFIAEFDKAKHLTACKQSLEPLQVNLQSTYQCQGYFELAPHSDTKLHLSLHCSSIPHHQLPKLIANIRRLADLDAPMDQIEQRLQHAFGANYCQGLRIPGLWTSFEAAVRAILGQQISVQGARTQLNRLVSELGLPLPHSDKKLFPSPYELMQSDLQMIKVPQARRQTLKTLAQFVLENPRSTPNDWLAIKGIGPWTVAYAQMRGLGMRDIWLAGDLGIKKALLQQENFTPESISPYRSYATFQLWRGL